MTRLTSTILVVFALLPGKPGKAEQPSVTANQQGFADILQPVFRQHCLQCHGAGGDAEADIDLAALKSVDDLIRHPELIEDLVEVLDSEYMPPEEESTLPRNDRDAVVAQLRSLLKDAVGGRADHPRTPMRRMTRFQYNNAVQDLFELNVVVFPLPERILREHGNYFQPQTGQMPDRLRAGSRPLGKSQLIEPRLGGVTAFPQDLRAEHGFDNRGDHLSLSPLLLESFLRLSRSIVESDDVNAKTCGIWSDFFAPPQLTDSAAVEAIVRQRLQRLLTRAFRRPVEAGLLDRYTQHVMSRLEAGQSFTDSMKDAAAAALASPRFFYLYERTAGSDDKPAEPLDDFDLASRLSFFLWGSIPDQELLDAAAAGELHQPQVLEQQVERMLRDRRIKRFCDSFPAQWLQLDRIISSAPDPQEFPQFYLSNEKYLASMHMMLEPLLLFETVLIENRSVLQFIDSDFSYRSNLLQAWYRDGSQGKSGPPTVVEFNRVPINNRREGGVITTAAVMTMTSGADHTKPITRGAWVASVILNDPPKPPPADVPPLPEEDPQEEQDLTIRERFAAHRERTDCAACHKRLDPLGFALENYNAAGIWRDQYENGRKIDASGKLFGRHEFADVVEFKDALLAEQDKFPRALAAHLLSFSLGREVEAADSLALDQIVERTAADEYRLQTLIKQVVLSDPFRH